MALIKYNSKWHLNGTFPTLPLPCVTFHFQNNFSLIPFKFWNEKEIKCHLKQCFSTDRPRPSRGPQNFIGGPPGFSHFITNQILRQIFHKNYKNVNLISYKSIKKQQSELILTQLKVWNNQNNLTKNARWAPKMFTLAFGGPPCFQRWEPLI